MYFLLLYCFLVAFLKLKTSWALVIEQKKTANSNTLTQFVTGYSYSFFNHLFNKNNKLFISGITTNLQYHFKIRQYSLFYKLVSRLFISYKHNIGDINFDDKTYILSSNTNLLTVIATEKRLRELILVIFKKYDAFEISCDPNYFIITFKSQPTDSALKATQEILQEINSLFLSKLQNTQEPFYKAYIYNDNKYNFITLTFLFITIIALYSINLAYSLPLDLHFELNSCFKNGLVMMTLILLLLSITSPYRHKIIFDFILIGIVTYIIIYNISNALIEINNIQLESTKMFCGFANKKQI
jgi:hypothetical protein